MSEVARGSARGRARWLTLTAVAAIASVLVAPASAQTDDEEDLGAADHLVLVRQTPWVAPDGAMGLRLRVDDAPPGAQLRMAVHGRIRNRTEFVRSLQGEGLRTRITDRATGTLDELTEDADGTVPLRILTGPVAGEEPPAVVLDEDDEGVYPVLVELLDADGVPIDRLVTHLLRLPADDPEEVPLNTILVLPLHAPPSHLRPGEVDAAALAPLDVTVDALLAHPAAVATIVATPEALAGAVDTDPAAAGRLESATTGRDVLPQPWVRLDATAWARAGLDDELAAQRAAGRDALVEVTGRPPDPSTGVVAAGAGEAGVAAAVDAGARVVIVPEADLEGLSDDFSLTLTRPFEVPTSSGTTVPALMADAALAAHADAEGDPVLGAHHLLADLAVLALDAPVEPRVAVVVLDEESATDPAFLDALLTGIAPALSEGVAPLAVTTTVDDALAAVEPAGASGDPDADDPLVRGFADDGGDSVVSLGSLRDDLTAATADIGSYRSVFGAADPLVADLDELVLTAGSADLSSTARRSVLDAGRDAIVASLAGIGPPPRQRVTLTARRGQVQLVLTNDTGRPADVAVVLRGDRLEFPENPDGRVDVHLEGPTTRVDLELEARSSGDAPLDLRLLTPDGRIELGRTRITVRTTAVSGVGLVLMGGAGLFLIVWWTRTILRERGTTRHRPAHAAPR